MRLVYVDTSAALKTLIDEHGTDRVRRVFEQATAGELSLVSSRLLRTEMYRVAFREAIPDDDVAAVLSHVALVDLTRALLDAAAALRFHVRTLDAIHLATAAELDQGEDRVHLLTADGTMRRRAQDLGLHLVR